MALNCVNSSLFLAAIKRHLSGELVVNIISRRPCLEFNRIARACSIATAVGMTASVQAQKRALEEVVIVAQGSTYGKSLVTESMCRQ
jgi:hypothetical protein